MESTATTVLPTSYLSKSYELQDGNHHHNPPT